MLITQTPKRLRTAIWVAMAMLGLILVIWLMTRDAPIEVEVVVVDSGPVQATVANTRAGSVSACRRARISPAAGGQVAHLYVKEGDRVSPEDVLLELWNEDVVAQLRLAREEAVAAQANMDDACVRAEDAEREAERLKRLHKRGLASDERRDQVVTAAHARAAVCRAAQAKLAVSEAQISAAQAAVDKTVLKAPFPAIVAEVYPEEGEFITPSPPGIPTPPAVDLIDDTCIYVTAPIDEVDAAAIRTGMRAVITLDAMRERKFTGTVRRVAPYVVELQKQARTVDVEVEFDKKEDVKELLTGYSADVEIVLAQRKSVLRVPSEAVTDGRKVLLLIDGELVTREFTPGLSNWRYTEVTDGLKQGDLLVTSLDTTGVEAGARAVRKATKP